MIPADCIGDSMAAKPFQSTYLQMCSQALVEVQGLNLQPSMTHAAQHCKPLGHSGSAILTDLTEWGGGNGHRSDTETETDGFLPLN